MTYLWDTDKTMFKEKVIALNAYVRKEFHLLCEEARKKNTIWISKKVVQNKER